MPVLCFLFSRLTLRGEGQAAQFYYLLLVGRSGPGRKKRSADATHAGNGEQGLEERDEVLLACFVCLWRQASLYIPGWLWTCDHRPLAPASWMRVSLELMQLLSSANPNCILECFKCTSGRPYIITGPTCPWLRFEYCGHTDVAKNSLVSGEADEWQSSFAHLPWPVACFEYLPLPCLFT